MTSFFCTSRQARTQRPQLMQASRLTEMAACVVSAFGPRGLSDSGRQASTPIWSIQPQNLEFGSWLSARGGWSAASSSSTISCDFLARSDAVFTFMPGDGLRWQEAASTRSPSTSTTQARQLPSAR